MIYYSNVVVRYVIGVVGDEGTELLPHECFHKKKIALTRKKELNKKNPKKEYLLEILIFTGEKIKYSKSFLPPRIATDLKGFPLRRKPDGKIIHIKKKKPSFDVNDIDVSFEVGMAWDWINGFSKDSFRYDPDLISDEKEKMGLDKWI